MVEQSGVPKNFGAEELDTELMLRYKKNRDKESFAKLVRRYQKGLVNFFYRLCWDASLSEDFAQEVFIRIAQNARWYKPSARFNTFLYTIARNIWIDYWRLQKNKPVSVSLDNELKENGHKERSFKDFIAAEQKHPEEILIIKETMERIKQVLKSMNEEQQVIINLCMFEGMSYEEVAEVIDLPLGTVKSRLHFALARLKELIK